MLEEFVLILFVIVLGILISVAKYIAKEKKNKKISFASLLIEMIKSLTYKRHVLDNDFPVYPGDLEIQDTEEYISFLDSGVLDVFGKSGDEG